LLVFKIGTDEGDGVNETATVAGFRKFLDDLEASSQALKVSSGTNLAPWNDSFAATTLQGLSSKVDIHQGYETWLRLLTDDQRDFALTDLTRPTRIEGPAGTGKTASISVAAVHALRMAKEQQRPLRCALFTHSEASRRSIQTVIEAMGGDEFLSAQPISCQLQIVTLQSYCASILHQDLSETEFVDPDAQDAKQLQLMYVEEAMNKTEPEFDSYAPFMSQIFINFYKNENKETLIQLIQHEISVVIKGRAQEKFETYKQIGKIPTGLPLEIDGDKAFIWQLYKNYRAQLVSNAQFDTDDVVLSAFGQLAAPIWRRRRAKDGFDKIFVDETHLFNMNELSIFHLITKSETSFPIAFAVDRSQAIGDRGWSDDIDVDSLMPDTSKSEQRTVALSGIFRCSPDIVNLAFCITSSGANLFTNFEDPMRLAHSNMTFEEEKKCSLPRYLDIDADKDMVKSAFEQAEIMRENMKSARSDIVIVAFSNEIYHEMEQLAKRDHKPVEFLKNRADLETVSKAKATGRFLLSLADYVGGLEFDGAVLVGVDEGRVPPTDTSAQTQSHAYMSFAAHNRLYVSVTRARYQVHILGERSRGPSKILAPAIERGVLLR
jgi:superfamily I DNA/RNA helicase